MAKVDFQSKDARFVRTEARLWIRPDTNRGLQTEPDFDVLWPDEERMQDTPRSPEMTFKDPHTRGRACSMSVPLQTT
jgi:hypothetical protein